MLQQACHDKVSTAGFDEVGLPQQAFHGRVCHNRLATPTYPQQGLLQQAFHNKLSTARFATARLPQQDLHSKVCYNRLATTRLLQQGLQQQACTTISLLQHLLQPACHNKVSTAWFATAGWAIAGVPHLAEHSNHQGLNKSKKACSIWWQ